MPRAAEVKFKEIARRASCLSHPECQEVLSRAFCQALLFNRNDGLRAYWQDPVFCTSLTKDGSRVCRDANKPVHGSNLPGTVHGLLSEGRGRRSGGAGSTIGRLRLGCIVSPTGAGAESRELFPVPRGPARFGNRVPPPPDPFNRPRLSMTRRHTCRSAVPLPFASGRSAPGLVWRAPHSTQLHRKP